MLMDPNTQVSNVKTDNRNTSVLHPFQLIAN